MQLRSHPTTPAHLRATKIRVIHRSDVNHGELERDSRGSTNQEKKKKNNASPVSKDRHYRKARLSRTLYFIALD